MERISWTDGWHEVNSYFSYYVEGGKIMYGKCRWRHELIPYIQDESGGLNNASGIKANKRNYDKLIWR